MSNYNTSPEHEHTSERSGRDGRLRSLPDIGLLRRIFKKRTVTTTIDEYEPDVGEYSGTRAATPDYRAPPSRYDPEDQILDRYSDGRRRLSIQQAGDTTVYRVDDERPVRPSSRRGGFRKYSLPSKAILVFRFLGSLIHVGVVEVFSNEVLRVLLMLK